MNSQGCQDGGYNYGCWQSKIAPFWIFDLSEIEESFIIESVHFNGYILGSAWTNTLVNISTNSGVISTSISSYLWQGGDWSSGNNNNNGSDYHSCPHIAVSLLWVEGGAGVYKNALTTLVQKEVGAQLGMYIYICMCVCMYIYAYVCVYVCM